MRKDKMRRATIALAAFVVTVGGITGIEQLGLHSGRLLECLLLFLFLVVVAGVARGWLRNAAVTAASLAFGLSAIQATFLVLKPKDSSRTAGVRNDNLVSSREVFGWGPRHPGVFHIVKRGADGRVIFDVHATIDEAYHRQTVPSAGASPIPFFGDSFIFGDGVNDGETLPQAFADLNRRKIPVLNLGFSGWAPSQNLAALQMEPYKSQLSAPRRMILFTALFHVERTACRNAFAWGSGPRYVIDGDSVRFAGTCVGSRPKIVNSVLQFVRTLLTPHPPPDTLTAGDVETYIKIVETFVKTARRDFGAGTTVLMEPGGDELIAGTGFTQARIVETLRKAGVDVLVKAEPPAGQDKLYRIEGDGHPTGLANKATARQIETHLREVDPPALEAAHRPPT